MPKRKRSNSTSNYTKKTKKRASSKKKRKTTALNSRAKSGVATGFGEYRVNKNSMLTTTGTQLPVVKNTNAGVIIRHKEFITNIQPTQLFTKAVVSELNPGNADLFPWLAPIAFQFEEYEWRGMIFEFRSLSSSSIVTAGLNGSLGTIIMATDYDVADKSYDTKREALNSQFSCSSAPSHNLLHPIECKRSNNVLTHLYVRDTKESLDRFDKRFCDLGRFQLFTDGMQSGLGICGELWVSYEVEFFKPQIPHNPVQANQQLIQGPAVGNTAISTSSLFKFGAGAGDIISSFTGNPIVKMGANSFRFADTALNAYYKVSAYWQTNGTRMTCPEQIALTIKGSRPTSDDPDGPYVNGQGCLVSALTQNWVGTSRSIICCPQPGTSTIQYETPNGEGETISEQHVDDEFGGLSIVYESALDTHIGHVGWSPDDSLRVDNWESDKDVDVVIHSFTLTWYCQLIRRNLPGEAFPEVLITMPGTVWNGSGSDAFNVAFSCELLNEVVVKGPPNILETFDETA